MAKKSEDSLIAWLAGQLERAHQDVPIGIGDDMAMLGDLERPAPRGRRPRQAGRRRRAGSGSSDQDRAKQGRTASGKAGEKQAGLQKPRPKQVDPQEGGSQQTGLLVTVDMLMDGVDFEVGVHPPELIGRKSLAASLSDCAAMAVRPRCALISVALPADWPLRQAQRLFRGIEQLADEFDCAIVGGDTNSWRHPLVVDVIVVGEPFNGVPPVRRDGMRPGDLVCVTGRLGGSLFVPDSENRQASQHSKQASASRARHGLPDSLCCWPHHLVFEPRVREARWLAERLGGDLHAMMDLSDGLSTDAHRMAVASGCGIEFDARALQTVVSPAAVQASHLDGRSPLDHLLNDGEDFELLFAVAPEAIARLRRVRSGRRRAPRVRRGSEAWPPDDWTCIGTAVGRHGLWLRDEKQRKKVLRPRGWQHFTDASQP